MKVVHTLEELRKLDLSSGGLVPTMGAFHEGHLSLMRTAKADTGLCAVSLFVNPTQFGKNEDLSRYPRPFERDVQLAESVGVDVLFAPSVEEMYADRPTMVSVPFLTDKWEGAYRPGHFDGVATVVLKLFNQFRTGRAYFGQKDLQQCLVIAKMVRDLNVPINLVFEPTVRESDGLAMSSRNVYLSPEERAAAVQLPRSLDALSQKLSASSSFPLNIQELITEEKDNLAKAGFDVDYLALVDLATLDAVSHAEGATALIAAAKIGKTRLIDNRILSSFPV